MCLLRTLFLCPASLPLPLCFQQIIFRDGEDLADGVIEPFRFRVTGYVRGRVRFHGQSVSPSAFRFLPSGCESRAPRNLSYQPPIAKPYEDILHRILRLDTCQLSGYAICDCLVVRIIKILHHQVFDGRQLLLFYLDQNRVISL